MIYQILLQLVLILLNAFFAAAEIALISLNEKKLRALADGGDKKAKKMLKIIENPTGFLSAIQIGITLAGFLGSAFAADNFAERLTGFIVRSFSVAPAYVEVIDTVSVIVITLILSYFTLVLGELVPKRVAMKYKDGLANAVCGFMTVLAKILKPIIWFLTVSTNLVLRLFRINPNENDESVSEEDIVIMLDAGVDEGTLEEDGIKYIKNVFKLDKLTAYDVMTPRAALSVLSSDASAAEILAFIEEEGYSRIPVYESGDDDKIIGILPVKEYLLKYGKKGFKLADVLITPEFVPSGMRLDDLLKYMQKNQIHMVFAIDEYGSVSGALTMEDILEEIVGEIRDESDEETDPITEISNGTYKVSAGISCTCFFDYFGIKPDEEPVSATVNGWISELFEDIPPEGTKFEFIGLNIEITSADEQSVKEITVSKSFPEEDNK